MSAPSTSVLDPFTVGADAAPPDANWTRFSGFSNDLNALAATDNVTGSVSSTGGDYWNPTSFAANQEAFVTVSTLPASTDLVELFVRMQGTPSSVLSGYRLVYTHGAPGTFALQRLDSGAATTLASANQTLTAGQKLWMSVVGTVLAGYFFNGTAWTQVVTYDTAGDATKYTTGGFIGLAVKNTTARVDDFGGGTIAAGSPPVNTVAPAVTGGTTVGSVLSTTNGTWTDDGSPTFTYQWKNAGGNIAGATSSTYTLVSGDVGSSIHVTVTDTDTNGATSADSNTVGPITGTPSGPPQRSDTAQQAHDKLIALGYSEDVATRVKNQWGKN